MVDKQRTQKEETVLKRNTLSLSEEIDGLYVSEAFVSKILNVRVSTLRKWAVYREGPKGRFRLGRNVMYDKAKLLSWIEELSCPARKGKR